MRHSCVVLLIGVSAAATSEYSKSELAGQLQGLEAQLHRQVAALAQTHAELEVLRGAQVEPSPGVAVSVTARIVGAHAGGAVDAFASGPALSRNEIAKLLFREFMEHDNFLHHGRLYEECVPDELDKAAGCEHCCSNCMDLAPLYVEAEKSPGSVSQERIDKVARAVARNGIDDGKGGVTTSSETIAKLKQAYLRGNATLPDEFPDFIGLRRLALWDLKKKGVEFDTVWERSGHVLQGALFAVLRDPFMRVHMTGGLAGDGDGDGEGDGDDGSLLEVGATLRRKNRKCKPSFTKAARAVTSVYHAVVSPTPVPTPKHAKGDCDYNDMGMWRCD